MSSTLTECLDLEALESELSEEQEIKQPTWLTKAKNAIGGKARTLVLSTLLSIAAVGTTGCAVFKSSLKNKIKKATTELIHESGFKYAGRTPDGGAMMCGEGATFTEAKDKAIKNIEAFLGTSELSHRYLSRKIDDGKSWVVCVISKKKNVIPQTAEEGIKKILASSGQSYCGKVGDTINGCGKGTTAEEAENAAKKDIGHYVSNPSLYIKPFVRVSKNADGTWAAVANTFPRPRRRIRKPANNNSGSSVKLGNIEVKTKPKTFKDLVMDEAKKSAPRIRMCYESVMKRASAKRRKIPKGEIEFAITIGPTGFVKRVKVVRDKLDEPSVTECAVGAITGWRFPKKYKGAKFYYPMSFKPTSF